MLHLEGTFTRIGARYRSSPGQPLGTITVTMTIAPGAALAASISKKGILRGNSSTYNKPEGITHITGLRDITVIDSYTMFETRALQVDSSVGTWTADL